MTRQAETALHSIPSAAAQRHLLPGNIAWTVLFGWWLSIVCFLVAAVIWVCEAGGGRFSALVWGLGWYIFWPFGKYVEGEGKLGGDDEEEGEDADETTQPTRSDRSDSSGTIRGFEPGHSTDDEQEDAVRPAGERDALLGPTPNVAFAHPNRSTSKLSQPTYGATTSKLTASSLSSDFINGTQLSNTIWHRFGQVAYWLAFTLVIAPLLFGICILCWGFVFTIPMAKLLWKLLQFLYYRPLELGFKPAPRLPVLDPNGPENDGSSIKKKHTRLRPGQVAPTGGPRSTVLLCTYKALGSQYYKYTVGGVNILFVNLVPLVFFVIADAWVLLPMTDTKDMGPILNLLGSRGVIFFLAISSVIPLSYFIGMAVASISAQSSIGMGAVINATFGSIIELILYCIALGQGKGRLVEGSIVGSLLAGVLLMPGVSMCAGAFRRKEQRFNAKSAGVTSTMLIMAIVGTLIPTVFYSAFGSVSFFFFILLKFCEVLFVSLPCF